MFRKKRTESSQDIVNLNSAIDERAEVSRYSGNLRSYTDLICPSGIDTTNSAYVVVDGTYISCLQCCTFPYQVRQTFFEELINYGEGIEIFINQIPENKSEIIKDITYYLGFTKYKMNQGDNQVDSGLQENAMSHSVYMKKKMAEGDDFWYMNVLVKVSADSEEKLNIKLRNVEGIMAGKDIFCKSSDFRQLEAFLSTLPLGKFDKRIQRQTERNILSSGLCSLYPFTSSSLSDPEGIFLGTNAWDESQVILDIFDTSKYANANMVLLGTTGSGKSFTSQMIVNRFRMQQIPVMMICPLKGHEYKKLCVAVGGNYFRFAAGSQHTINIFDIRETKNIENTEESRLAAKLRKLQICFTLMFPGIGQKELQMLDDVLMQVYQAKGITMDNASIYEKNDSDKVISLKPKIKEMPIMEDVYRAIDEIEELRDIRISMKPFVSGSLSFFNGQTNVDLDNQYIVADVSDVQKDLISLAMFVVLDIFWDRIKADVTQKICLLLDEVWRLMGAGGNQLTAEFVLEIFKIIRGYAGSGIAATQDIQDFMALEDGKYGRGIINNAKLKIVLQLEEFEAKALQPVLNLSEEEMTRITHFKRGSGLLYAGSNHLAVNFLPFETEKRLITTDRKERMKYQEEEHV